MSIGDYPNMPQAYIDLLKAQVDAQMQATAMQNMLGSTQYGGLPNPLSSGIGIGPTTSTSILGSPSTLGIPPVYRPGMLNIPIEQLEKYVKTEEEYVKVLELFREFIDKWGETEFHGEEDQELYKWLTEEFIKIAELNQKV